MKVRSLLRTTNGATEDPVEHNPQQSSALNRGSRPAHGCSGLCANASPVPTELAPKHAPRDAPNLAPWFPKFCATTGAPLRLPHTDTMLCLPWKVLTLP